MTNNNINILNMKYIKVKISLLIVIICLINGNVFAQTKTETETVNIITDNISFTAEAKRSKSYLEVRIYNNNPNKTYKINFSAKVTLRSDKGEYNDLIKTSITLKPNSNGYGMSYGSHFANAVTREIYSTLVDAEFDNFNVEEVGNDENSNKTNNNSKITSSNTTSTSTTETRYNTNPQVTEAVERQNRLNNLQNEQQKREQAAKEFMEKNQRDFEVKQKQQQQTTQDVLALGNAITDLINENAERRDAENARKRANQLRIEEEARSRKEALETKIANRKSVLAEFPANDIPLGSKEKAQKIYYFIYAYDNTINNEYGATVYISNVFEIGKYNDGTRAYTATVKNEIVNLTPFIETLHGYYFTQQEAEQLRQSLISILKTNGVVINEVNYKGKVVPESSKTDINNKKEDFWGVSKNDQNTAPAKINTPTKGVLNIRTEEDKKEKEKKEKEFWD